MSEEILRVHSIETCGTVDGPGIRFVLFLQGCPLRCQFCHNPDTWKTSGGTAYTIDQLFDEIVKYKSYMRFSKGGLTVTGGEPLLQVKALLPLFKKCKEAGIHTAIDTSGYIFNEHVEELLTYTDLVLLDIKHFDPVQYQHITGVELAPTLRFLDYTRDHNLNVWIRYVLVPGLSDQLDTIEALSKHLSLFPNISRIDILPFHKMGEFKWAELGLDYQLSETIEPSKSSVQAAMEIFKKHNEKTLVF